MVYFAEHPALAALEVRVHLDLPFELLPDDFVLMHASMPNRLIELFAAATPPEDTVAIGDAWLTNARHAALRVPSALLPHCTSM